MPRPKKSETALNPQLQKVYEQLKQVRASKTISLKPSRFLRHEIVSADGSEQPLKLRYYQVQGTFHMLVLRRMVLGDSTGLGKTLISIASLAYLWEKEPRNRALVIAPKSALRQWAAEIERFTKDVRPIVVGASTERGKAPAEARRRLYEEWLNAPSGTASPKVVLITSYAILARDWYHDSFQPTLPNGKPDPKQPVRPGLLDRITAAAGQDLVVIFDEASAFRNMRTRTWEVVRFLSDRSHRVYGLTATLLKNNLMDGYAIFKAIKPDLFSTKSKFYEDYCHVQLKAVAGRRKVPVVVGYKNLEDFRARIDPFFLGRSKHTVSEELPVLTTREVVCELSRAEDSKYAEALTGVLELGDGQVREFEETKALTSLIYCQQVVNSLWLLNFRKEDDLFADLELTKPTTTALGAKEQELVDLLTGELENEKVIVYTRFEKLVGRLQDILAKVGIQSVRITGKESDKKRRESQAQFLDLQSEAKVIFITDAGSEAINLQAAAAMVFYDMPWAWGAYVQLLGRMIRIGSPHRGVLAFHLIAERATGGKTIDHHVLSLLRRKKNVIDQVLGEAAVGALTFERSGSPARDLLRAMKESARAA